MQQILKNENIHRSIKPSAFHALGDLSLNSGDSFNKLYLEDTLCMLDSAAQMTCMQNQETPPDQDYKEFIFELRDEIILQYTTILISVADSEDPLIK